MEPAEVRIPHDGHGRTGDALDYLAMARAQEPLRGEERHLRVVGDRPDASVGLVHVPDAIGAVALADLREREELDRRAERIAHGAAEEAAAEDLLEAIFHRSLRTARAGSHADRIRRGRLT